MPVCVSGRGGGPSESLNENNHPKGWIFFWQKAEREIRKGQERSESNSVVGLLRCPCACRAAGADRANLSMKITTQKGGYFFGKKQRERFEKTPHPSAFSCHLLPLEKALVKIVRLANKKTSQKFCEVKFYLIKCICYFFFSEYIVICFNEVAGCAQRRIPLVSYFNNCKCCKASSLFFRTF